MDEVETVVVNDKAVRAQSEAILQGWGMDTETATVTAEVLVDCDLRGIDTHGISLLALYAGWIRDGGFDLIAKPVVEREGPSYGLIDARGGLGFAVSVRAVEMAVEKAAETGISAVGVKNSHHFGAAGYYARLAGRAGMVGLVTTSTKVVCMVPPGASEPVLGTNPLAYAVPRKDGAPVVFDMATSTAAGNKIRLHHLKSIPIPEGWVVDGQGKPVTDPHEAYKFIYERDEGGLTPLGALPHLGSHKGYGLSLLVHFLGGTLPGGNFAGSSSAAGESEGDSIGHFFLAINPDIFRGIGAFLEDVEDVAHTLESTPAVDPSRPVLLPGDIEEQVRSERLREGIPIAATLIQQLSDISNELDVPFYLKSIE